MDSLVPRLHPLMKTTECFLGCADSAVQFNRTTQANEYCYIHACKLGLHCANVIIWLADSAQPTKHSVVTRPLSLLLSKIVMSDTHT